MLLGIGAIIGAGIFVLTGIAAATNIGTLAAFVIVCAGVFVLRLRQPAMARPFRIRFGRTVSILGALSCLYLMTNLGPATWLRFVAWMLVGLVLYFGYARGHSFLANDPDCRNRSLAR